VDVTSSCAEALGVLVPIPTCVNAKVGVHITNRMRVLKYSIDFFLKLFKFFDKTAFLTLVSHLAENEKGDTVKNRLKSNFVPFAELSSNEIIVDLAYVSKLCISAL
jgi:hypothetical protein